MMMMRSLIRSGSRLAFSASTTFTRSLTRVTADKMNAWQGRKGILERLAEGPVIGDGGCIWEMEKRGYVKAGPYTPEVTVEHPEAVRQLHREYLRAGADVMQTLTYNGGESKFVPNRSGGSNITASMINEAACDIAREVADEGGALVGASISQTMSYARGRGKECVQSEFRKQVEDFMRKDVDLFILEFFVHMEEMEWAIEEAKKSGLPLAATMTIGPLGTPAGESAGACAVRMADAGADIVGVNCRFGPDESLEAVRLMREALDARGRGLRRPYLMAQPLCAWTADAGINGYTDMKEFPFAMERRICSRWDIQKFARSAWRLGVRYIGLCCGAGAYHVRAIAEELAPERGGRKPPASEKHGEWGSDYHSDLVDASARTTRDYWENMEPGDGRPAKRSEN